MDISKLLTKTADWLDFNIKKLGLKSYQLKLTFLVVFTLLLIHSSNNQAVLEPTLELKKPIIRDFSFALPDPAPFPKRNEGSVDPSLNAEGVVLLEPVSFKTIYAKNENQKLYPASITKLLTALTVLDYYSLDEVITVPPFTPEGQVMGLVPGEKIRVKDLLYGLLVKSGNDAAMVLADNEKIKKDQFIYSMNENALKLHMNNTHLNNPSGLDDELHYTTPKDVALLGAAVIKNPTLSEIVKTKKIVVSDVDKKYWHDLENVNTLLGEIGVIGIKTGFTDRAGECLLAYSNKDGKQLISVVLNSKDRFTETRSLLEWGYRSYSW